MKAIREYAATHDMKIVNVYRWFVVSALNVSVVSFWAMYGLHMFATLFTEHGDGGFLDEVRWEGAATILDACVPAERRASLSEQVKEQSDRVWVKLGLNLLGTIVKYRITLAIGWGIHATLL